MTGSVTTAGANWTAVRLKQLIVTIAVGALMSVFALTSNSRAAELLMFDDPGCIWCKRWHEQIGPAYPKSEEGQRAPLRVLQRRARVPSEYKLKSPITMTPIFVLVDDRGREVDRIMGYPPGDYFWSLLGEMLDRLPANKAPAALRQISIKR